ncbi:uncharacterized protein LOC103521095, partial [Diaphorina citri]|uniref:Uncharacterized protein LOC103521095 n=1 Tax=Diaphorina citri TaxID=121845 RepID=A0A3Q0JLJ5_DIACI
MYSRSVVFHVVEKEKFALGVEQEILRVDEDLEMPSLSDQNELPPLSPNPQLERLLSQENTDPTSSDLYPPEYPPNQNTLPSDNISSSDASMLLEHFESLELSNDYPPDSPPSPPPFPPPNMAYLKSFLNQLKQNSHKEEQELLPSSLPDPEPCPSIPYLTALLQKLKHKEDNTRGNLPQSLPYPHELPSALDSFHNVPYLDTDGSLLPHQTLPVGLTEHNTSSLHFDSRTPFEGTSPNFLTDRSRSNFYSYQPEELGDALDQEVFEATQNIQTLPMKVSPQLPEVYTHLPTIQPNLPKHGLSTPSPIITNWPSSLPPSLPSPSLSMYNKPSSSKSSTPE